MEFIYMYCCYYLTQSDLSKNRQQSSIHFVFASGQSMQYIGNLDGYQSRYNTRSSVNFQSFGSSRQASVNQSRTQSTAGGTRPNSSLISLSPTSANPSSSTMASANQSSFMRDLEGLDFSMTASLAPSVSTTDTSTAAKIYPDISSAFR